MLKWITISIGVLLLIIPQNAYSAAKTTLSVVDPRMDGGSIKANVSVRGVGDEHVSFDVKDLGYNQKLSLSQSLIPVRLWILVEASQMCQVNHLDTYLAKMIGQLRRSLPGGSRVSVVTFTNSLLEVVANDQRSADLENLAIRCESNATSGSYEKALLRLVDSMPSDGLKTVVWAFTAGSISVTEATQSKLEKKSISVNLVLYNALMEGELQRVLDRQNSAIGKKIFSLSVLNTAEGILPERWYELDITVPGYLKDNVLNVSVTAAQKQVAVGSDSLSMRVDLGQRGFWANWGGTILLLLGVFVLTGIVISLIRFYRAKPCASCGKTLRHKDQLCVFCQSKELACLVGEFNQFERRKKAKQDVVYLTRARNDIGLRRHHAVRLSGKRSGKSLFATIVSEVREDGKKSYLLLPEVKGMVLVNGLLAEKPRYLGHGDKIVISGSHLTFVYGGFENEARA